jgi:hypothetical protein
LELFVSVYFKQFKTFINCFQKEDENGLLPNLPSLTHGDKGQMHEVNNEVIQGNAKEAPREVTLAGNTKRSWKKYFKH